MDVTARFNMHSVFNDSVLGGNKHLRFGDFVGPGEKNKFLHQTCSLEK